MDDCFNAIIAINCLNDFMFFVVKINNNNNNKMYMTLSVCFSVFVVLIFPVGVFFSLF